MSFISSHIFTPEYCAEKIQNEEVVGISGFTLAGYPKLIPKALAQKAMELHAIGKPFKITLFSGASTGDSCDGNLIRAHALQERAPYQSNASIRESANSGELCYLDEHLGVMGLRVREGTFKRPTTVILEASHIEEDGKVYLSTSGGNTKAYVENARQVFIEWNTRYSESLKGLHDTYLPPLAPNARPIPILKANDRIGDDFLIIPKEKLAGIVLSDKPDEVKPFSPPDSISETIAGFILDFLSFERKKGRLPNALPYQSGVGNVANAVLSAMANDPQVHSIDLYTEVIQEACIPLLKANKLNIASGTALTLSQAASKEFLENVNDWKKHFILRQQEVSNSPEVIRRLGVISMNTAIECDIFGNVNSSHVCGTSIMNGIGGAADFARHARLGFFMTPSTAKNGAVSSIVPLVSHVDHTEHDTQVFVTEQGIADLRGLNAIAKAKCIIENCAHPDFRAELLDELEYGLKNAKGKHYPISLERAFAWHKRYLETGSMKAQKP